MSLPPGVIVMSRTLLTPPPEIEAPAAQSVPRPRLRRSWKTRLATWLGLGLLIGGGLTYGGYWVWPYLGYAVAPAGAWLLLLTAHTWRRPRQATRLANLWLGTLALVAVSAGVLEWYASGWGGIAGEMLMGPTFAIGVTQMASLGFVAILLWARSQRT